MLSCLEQVRQGLMTPATFQKAEVTRRTLNFSLSSVSIVDPVMSGAVFSLDVDSTGRYLLSGANDGTWYIHDTFNLSGQIDHKKRVVCQCPRQLAHTRSIGTVEWYPADNGLFVTSSSDGKLFLWDANKTSRPVDSYDLDEPISRHHINPSNGSLIAACSDGDVSIIDVRIGSSIQSLPETFTTSKEVRWSPYSHSLLLVGTEQGHLLEWDIRSTHNYRCYGALGVKVVRRGVRTRDFKEQANILARAHEGPVMSIRYSKDGMEFYSFGGDGRIRRWKSETHPNSEALISTLTYGQKPPKGHGNFQIGLSSETDPPIVFVPKGNTISVCNMRECKVEKELVGHFKFANCFTYDDMYQQGYSGGNDSAVMVWNGNLASERAYQIDKKEQGAGGTSAQRPAANKASSQLISLIDDDDEFFEEEYDVIYSSDDEEVSRNSGNNNRGRSRRRFNFN